MEVHGVKPRHRVCARFMIVGRSTRREQIRELALQPLPRKPLGGAAAGRRGGALDFVHGERVVFSHVA